MKVGNLGTVLNKRKELLALAFLFVTSFVLRFYNLSYSEFQGDEIRALYDRGTPLWDFLIAQKKGPIQFLATYFVSLASADYDELLTRFPFALAGLLSVFVFYFFIKELYGRRIAFISSLLFSFNGFFVAFSRIVQYQSFTLLFSLLGLFCLSKLVKRNNPVFLVLSALSYAVAFLSHYDAAFTVVFALYFLYLWVKRGARTLKYKLVWTFSSLVVFLLLTCSFYVPFVLNPSFSSGTTSYFETRLKGEEGKTTSTLITYSVYNPLLSVYLLALSLMVALLFCFRKVLPVVVWFAFPFLILNFMVSVPGTHIFNYVLPASILSAFGLDFIAKQASKNKAFSYVVALTVSLALGFLFYQSYVIFIDHTVEYPWFEKKILVFTAKLPDDKYHLSLFGFPYNRSLKLVNWLVWNNPNVRDIQSNENSKIVRFYVQPLPSLTPNQTAYVYVYGAQSLMKTKKSIVSKQNPDAVFYRGSVPLSEVFFIKDQNASK
ncbi:MAG: glycosyltransferase family 39 protein [Patescibacteria group bacterium]